MKTNPTVKALIKQRGTLETSTDISSI